MSGPNILTATFQGIDAFSVVTQPYNIMHHLWDCHRWKLPILFSLPPAHKNNLWAARTVRICWKRCSHTQAWSVLVSHRWSLLSFPHYDARPRLASFFLNPPTPTCVRLTDQRPGSYDASARILVGALRRCPGGWHLGVSPTLPRVVPHSHPDPFLYRWCWDHRRWSIIISGVWKNVQFGARLFSRLEALGLPTPNNNNNKSSGTAEEEEGGEADRRLFRSE